MKVIDDCIQSIKALMDEIAAASVEQSEMIVQVENGIREISRVVQTNSVAAFHKNRVFSAFFGKF